MEHIAEVAVKNTYTDILETERGCGLQSERLKGIYGSNTYPRI